MRRTLARVGGGMLATIVVMAVATPSRVHA